MIRRLAPLLTLVFMGMASAARASDVIETFYYDGGMTADQLFVWGPGVTVGPQIFPPPPEGRESLQTFGGALWGGFGFFYDTPKNLGVYTDGDLRFWLRTNTRDIEIKIQMQGTSGPQDIILRNNLTEGEVPNLDQWTYMKINLSGRGIDFTKILSPLMITRNVMGSFYVDHVRWTALGDPDNIYHVEILDRASNAPASDITWSTVTLPAAWAVADQYLRIAVDPGASVDFFNGDFAPWGVQIYTDNASPAANPRYAADVSSTNPAGLVDAADPYKRLPMCWRAVDTATTTLTIVQGADNSLYSEELGGPAGQFPCFIWMKDKATPSIPSQNTPAFANGEDAVTLWDNEGIHFSDGPKNWGVNWGGVKAPVYVYLGARFNDALTPRTYKTNQLSVEFFTE